MDFFIIRPSEKPFNQIEQKWICVLEKQLKEVMKHNIPFMRIAFISIYGSQNYNLAGPYSDVDTECFVFPAVKDLLFITKPISFKIHTDNGDIYVKDIRQMFDELRKCSPNVLELLASKYMLINEEYECYILAMLMNVDRFAKLSTYKLLKGLEGLLHRYTKEIDMCPKYLVNALRIEQMIEHTLQGQEFSSCLIPDNATGLFNLKYGEPDQDQYNFLNKETYRIMELLEHYYCTHELTFNPNIKEAINDFQEEIMLKYLHKV